MEKILIVEDEEAISTLIHLSLSGEGYHCTCAFDGNQAADLLEYIKPLGIPVIFITAKGSLDDRIKGLRMGAEDYIVKPFQVGELIARVEVVLRRYGKAKQEITIGDVQIYPSSRMVKRDGQPVELTSKEFDLLLELIYHKNVALYRDQLYERVWGSQFYGETRTLDSHIQRLRKKLGWENRIKTVFRIGYRLEVSE